MVVLFRPTDDIFDFIDYVDVLVNPVSCMGQLDRGLAKEISSRYPQIVSPYQNACLDQVLHPGGYIETSVKGNIKYVLSLATSVKYSDRFDLNDLENVLLGLREYLTTKRKHYYKVLMPMLKVYPDEGKLEDVKNTFIRVLGSLPHVVTVTQRPQQISLPPYFTGVLGEETFMAPTLSSGSPNLFCDKEKEKLMELLEKNKSPENTQPYIVLNGQSNFSDFFIGSPIESNDSLSWCSQHKVPYVFVMKNGDKQKESHQEIERDLYVVSLSNKIIYCAHSGPPSTGFHYVYDKILEYRKQGVYKELVTTWEMSGEMLKGYEESWKDTP